MGERSKSQNALEADLYQFRSLLEFGQSVANGVIRIAEIAIVLAIFRYVARVHPNQYTQFLAESILFFGCLSVAFSTGKGIFEYSGRFQSSSSILLFAGWLIIAVSAGLALDYVLFVLGPTLADAASYTFSCAK